MINIFEAETKWILAHEKLLIVTGTLAATLYLGSMWIGHSSDKAIAEAAAAKQVVAEQVARNADISKMMLTQTQQYQQLVNTLVANNQSIVSAMAARQTAVQQQQKVDQTLPLPDLAIRWEKLAGLQPSDIVATDKGLTVNEEGSRTTVQILETVPVLQMDVKDSHQIIINKDQQIGGLDGLVTGLRKQVDGLTIEIKDKDAACTTQLNVQKAEARKSKRNWFIGGLITGAGVVARLLI
jgi:hypothetical protein